MQWSSPFALLAAAYGIVGFVLTQIGVGALLLLLWNMHLGNPWALMLAPAAVAAFVLAVIALRNLAAVLR